jgi:hypothetical protein
MCLSLINSLTSTYLETIPLSTLTTHIPKEGVQRHRLTDKGHLAGSYQPPPGIVVVDGICAKGLGFEIRN